MSLQRPYRLQQVVRMPGRHTVGQSELARRLVADLSGDLAGPRNLVDQVFAASGIESRHLELDWRSEGSRSRGVTAVADAGLDLATRALCLALDGLALEEPCALLVVSDAPASLHAGLAGRLAKRLQLPEGSLLRDFGAASLRSALIFGQRLLRHRLARDVLLMTVSTLGSLEWSAPLSDRPTLSEVLERSTASDAAAVLHLSSVDRPGSLLRYREVGNLPIAIPGAAPAPPEAAGALDWRGVSRRWLEGMRGWLVSEAQLRPTLFVSGAMALPFLLAEGETPMGDCLRLSREVYREHGDLGVSSAVFSLARALEEQIPLAPELRFVALEPGSSTSMVLLEGVELDLNAGAPQAAARRT